MTGADVATRGTGEQLAAMNPMEVAQHFVASGWFKDATDESKAVVKILAGQEMGIAPMASMQGIHIIEGKPSLSANLLGTLVKRHPAYDYIPVKVEDNGAQIAFFQNGEKIGDSIFTMKDAERAGLAGKANFKKWPKAMLFARCLSQGVRWYCPDVTAGSPAYVPEELGAEVQASGEPVEHEDRGNGITEIPAAMAEQITEEEAPASEAEVVDTIDEKRQAALVAGIKVLGLTFDEINLALGAAGIDALRAKSAKAVRETLAALTPDEAAALEVQLGNEADSRA